jgi:hypothetical protein
LRFASIFLSRFPSTPNPHLQNAAQNGKFLAAALWGASTPFKRSNEGEGLNPSPSRLQFCAASAAKRTPAVLFAGDQQIGGHRTARQRKRQSRPSNGPLWIPAIGPKFGETATGCHPTLDQVLSLGSDLLG